MPTVKIGLDELWPYYSEYDRRPDFEVEFTDDEYVDFEKTMERFRYWQARLEESDPE